MVSYKKTFKQSPAFYKHIEVVYEGFENFSVNESNYEITEADIHFIRTSKL
jgi:hypothetical protein